MKRRHLVRTAASLSMPFFMFACSWGPTVWVEEERTLELDAAGVELLRAVTDNGRIHVRAGDEGTTQIRVEVTIKAGGQSEEDARSCLEGISIETPRIGSTQTLKSGMRTRRQGWRRSVSFAIVLPSHLGLDLETDNGKVWVEGVTGPCTIRTDNGSVEVRDDDGDLDIVTDNGSIRVETMSRKVDLRTDNGSITIALGASGALDVRLETDNGSVTVDLRDDASARIVAQTDNGRIKSHLPLADVEHKKKSLRARLGDADGVVEVVTDNGGITFK